MSEVNTITNTDDRTNYPHYYKTSISLKNFKNKYDTTNLDSHQILNETDETLCSVTGRIFSMRSYGKKLFFCDLRQNETTVQILANRQYYSDEEEFKNLIKTLHRGDIVGVTGYPTRSKLGEFSIMPQKLIILTPCQVDLPSEHFGIKNPEVRYRKRYLDLIISKRVRTIFRTRSTIIKFIRKYLDDLDFLEVETQVLHDMYGGANAKPFITYHNDQKKEMFLRIAPELQLKELVVGGFDRVYEIGKQFRNESIDRTHNPEFTSLEFYMAYTDYNELMKMCEKMLSELVMQLFGSYEITYKEKQLNFTPPFKRIDIIEELEKNKIYIPRPFWGSVAEKYLRNICKIYKIDINKNTTNAKMIDKLIEYFIEPLCQNPTFVINHPQIMSPLAKWNRNDTELTERFELFVSGFELCNAYTELNDPIIQKALFEKQQQSNDEEKHTMNEHFVDVLRTGLPPTGGFGMGIDRLVMLLTNNESIREVILFPTLA